jgi:glycosyltransferase involved in cell wall biosynthesis
MGVHHHLTNSLPHTVSGYTQRTQGMLTALSRAGWRVSATTRAGYPVAVGRLVARSEDDVDGIVYRRLMPWAPPGERRDPAEVGAALLGQQLDRNKPRLVHATTPPATGEVARRAAERRGLPWIYEVRGFPEQTWAANQPTAARREEASRSERFRLWRDKGTELALAADAVLTLGETMRAELLARGVPADNIAVVPNSINAALLDRPLLAPARARARLGLDLPGFVVGSVGSVVPYEGLDLLVRLVALARRRGLEVSGLIVGDGVARPDLIALAARLGVRDRICFPGSAPPATGHVYLSALDAVLVPRRDEPLTRLVTPLKPVEALAAGRPLIVSDLPALRETISAAGMPLAGLAAPAGDIDAWLGALGRLMDSPALRSELSEAGRDLAATRTWERAARLCGEIYEQRLDRG